jgi:predicted peptidase
MSSRDERAAPAEDHEEEKRSSNSDLEVLQLRATGGWAELTPPFARESTKYSASVASDIANVQVRAGAWVNSSDVSINGAAADNLAWKSLRLKPGANVFEIEVRSTDGSHRKTYLLDVMRDVIQSVVDSFRHGTFRSERLRLTMPYRLFVPEMTEARALYPLVLFLNGGDRTGVDNESQLLGSEGATVWAKPCEQAVRPCFVLAPQSRPVAGARGGEPLGGFGITRNALGERFMDEVLEPSADVQVAAEMLDSVLDEFPQVDRRRVYVTGLSQGGFGTWNIACLRPELFAAAVPIAGGGDPRKLHAISHLPVWAFHAERDPVVPVGYSRRSVAALQSAGGSPRFTEYPAGTDFEPHEHAAWVYAYADEALRIWMFNQRKPMP